MVKRLAGKHIEMSIFFGVCSMYKIQQSNGKARSISSIWARWRGLRRDGTIRVPLVLCLGK